MTELQQREYDECFETDDEVLARLQAEARPVHVPWNHGCHGFCFDRQVTAREASVFRTWVATTYCLQL